MQTLDPIVSPMTNLDQLRVKIPQQNNIEAGTASPDHPPATALPAPPPPPLDSTGNNSSCTEISHPSPPSAEGDLSPTALDNTANNLTTSQQPHHLLKHHLRPENAQALSHFDTDNDIKEASREISKMGQRDLQAKFKLVYGTQTHSNNNEWLRRKLYEAIGALPVKTNTNKSKGRRHHYHHQGALAHQLPKLRINTGSPSTGGTGGGLTINNNGNGGPDQQQHGTSSPRGGKRGGLLRSPASTPRKLIAMELKRRMSLVPNSPRMHASSVLDAHRNISDETDSSGDDSDDDSNCGGNGGLGGFGLDDERQDESTIVGNGDGKGGMAVPRATGTTTATGGGGHLRSFTRLASQHHNTNTNNTSSVVIGTFLAQDVAYYTPPNPPHQALVTGNTGSGAGAAAMRRVSRAGLSRLHPTYWQQHQQLQQHRQQQQQQQQPAAKPASMVGWMPRSSSTTQLLKSMDLDVLGDREWPDALRFNPHDSFNLASMPDDEEFYDDDEQQQFQMEGVNAASGVME